MNRPDGWRRHARRAWLAVLSVAVALVLAQVLATCGGGGDNGGDTTTTGLVWDSGNWDQANWQ